VSAEHQAIASAILATLRADTAAEVAGARGMAHLAVQIRQALAPLLGAGRVERVFFTQFIVE
jgi:flagellar basal body-associated protein FliL